MNLRPNQKEEILHWVKELKLDEFYYQVQKSPEFSFAKAGNPGITAIEIDDK